MSANIGEVVYTVNADSSGLDKKMADVNSRLEKDSARGSGAIHEIWTGALRRVGEAFVELGRKGVDALKSIVNEGLNYNAQIESYEQAMTVALRSQQKLTKDESKGLSTLEQNELKTARAAKQAGEVIEKVKADAAKTPFSVSGLAEAQMLLISAGVSADGARDTIMALGDAVAATGGGSDVLSRMGANLQQIKNVGKATSMDIRQFAMAGIDIYGTLADYTGKTTKEVQEMDVSYDVLTKALEAAAKEGGRYYGGMSMQAQTYNGKISTLKDNFSQFAGKATESLSKMIASEGGVLDKATDILQKLTDAMTEGGLEGAFDALRGMFETEFIPMLGDIAEQAWEKGLELIRGIGFGFAEGGPELMANGIQAVTDFVNGLGEKVKEFVGAGFTMVSGLIQGFVNGLPGYLAKVPELVTGLVGTIEGLKYKIIDSGWEIIKKLAVGIWDNREVILTTIWNTVVGVVQKFLSYDWLGLGNRVLHDVINGIRAVVPVLWNYIKQAAQIAWETFRNINWLQLGYDVVTFILNGLGRLFHGIPQKLKEIGQEAINAFKSVDWLGVGRSVIDGIVSGIKAAPGAIKDAVVGLAKGAWTGVKNFFGIHSPSSLMRETVGQPIGEGMAVGITDTRAEVAGAMDDLSKTVYDTALNATVNYDLPDMSAYAQDLGASLNYQSATTIEVPLYMDGREIARASAFYMGQQLAWEG